MEKKAARVDEDATRLKTLALGLSFRDSRLGKPTSEHSLQNSCYGLLVNDLLIGLFCLLLLDVLHCSFFERF